MSRREIGVHYFAVAVAGSTFLLLLAGALVTSNDAGLSVPDWPLSHGQLMPEMTGGVFFEHGHRMIASGVGLLTIVLSCCLWRIESRVWVKRLGWLALTAVIIQGVLGGITVLLFLPPLVSIIHASLAPLFFSMVVTLSVVTSPWWKNLSDPLGQVYRAALQQRGLELKWAMATTLGIYLQYVLGATVRHLGTVEGTKGAQLVMPALVVHLMGALLLAALIVVASGVVMGRSPEPTVIRLLNLERALIVVQLVLGGGAFLMRVDPTGHIQPTVLRVWITTAHLALGAMLLATSLIVLWRLAASAALQQREPLLAAHWSGQAI